MKTMLDLELEATHLRDRLFAVRPVGCLGTCGWKRGVAWQAVYVHAENERYAVEAAKRQLRCSERAQIGGKK